MKQLLLCLLLLPALARAQALRGHITDPAGQPVPYASVAVPLLHQGTTADAAGAFALPEMPAGAHTLEVSAVGYGPARLVVTLPASQPLRIRLA
jgi:iron complex outermembrane receptor protein